MLYANEFNEEQIELLTQATRQFKTAVRQSVGYQIEVRDDRANPLVIRADAGKEVLKLGKKLLAIHKLERKLKARA